MPAIDKSLKTIDGAGLKSYTSKLTGLSDNTKYYVRAYATTSTGTTYGDQVIFNTPADPLKFHFYKDQYSDTTLMLNFDINSG